MEKCDDRREKNQKKKKHYLPIKICPLPLQIINRLFLFTFTRIFLVLEKYVQSASILYGRLIRVWVLIFPFFAITHPEDLQTVLSSRKHTEKIFFYKLLHNFLGNGLITSSGEKLKVVCSF